MLEEERPPGHLAGRGDPRKRIFCGLFRTAWDDFVRFRVFLADAPLPVAGGFLLLVPVALALVDVDGSALFVGVPDGIGHVQPPFIVVVMYIITMFTAKVKGADEVFSEKRGKVRPKSRQVASIVASAADFRLQSRWNNA